MEFDPAILKKVAAALAALPLAGVGLAVGKVFCSVVEAVSRNPSAQDKIFTIGILGAALTEAIGLFALLVVFLILYA